MGLKCSVLGHAYGETTVERDREERGSEVVVTIRELETCNRCGKSRVVTENKEVTAVETPEDASIDAAGEEGDDATEASTTAADAAPSTDPGEGPAAGTGSPDVADSGPAPDSVADEGAEILDAESGDAADEEPVDDELASPSIEGEDDEPAVPDESDAVFIDDETEEQSAADGADEGTGADAGQREVGEWPEEDQGDEDTWSPDTDAIIGEDETADPDPEPNLSTGSAVTVPDGEFYCEECGFTTPVESSSLRAGDFCPECHQGTLVHRPEN